MSKNKLTGLGTDSRGLHPWRNNAYAKNGAPGIGSWLDRREMHSNACYATLPAKRR
jgi:hypothetical protein